MFKFAISVLLSVLCQNGFAQAEFPFNEVVWKGPSGARIGENFEYFLFSLQGSFPGPSWDEAAAIIAEWEGQHPNAKVVPVSIYGEKSRFPIVYIWAVDGEDNLNLFLVKKGIFPAIMLLDTVQFNQLLKLSENTPYIKAVKERERIGNPKGVPSRRLVSDLRYEEFLKQLIAAETTAQVELNGMWSEKFKHERDKVGIIPLSAMQISIAHPE